MLIYSFPMEGVAQVKDVSSHLKISGLKILLYNCEGNGLPNGSVSFPWGSLGGWGGKVFPAQVLQLWREMYQGRRESRNTTKSHQATNITQEIYWERKTQKGDCLRLSEKHQESWAEGRIFIDFHGVEGGRVFQVEISKVGIGAFLNPELEPFTL